MNELKKFMAGLLAFVSSSAWSGLGSGKALASDLTSAAPSAAWT